MPKRPTKPSMSVPALPVDDDADLGSGRHRCNRAASAIILVNQLSARLSEHVDVSEQALSEVRASVDDVRGDLGEVNGHVNDLRVEVAKISSTVDNIDSVLTEQQQINRARAIADVDVGKAEKLAEIEDTTDRKKARRAFWLKVGMVAVGLGGTVAGMLIEHYR